MAFDDGEWGQVRWTTRRGLYLCLDVRDFFTYCVGTSRQRRDKPLPAKGVAAVGRGRCAAAGCLRIEDQQKAEADKTMFSTSLAAVRSGGKRLDMRCPLTIQRGSFFAVYGGGTHTHSGPGRTRRGGREFGGFGMQRAVKCLRGLSTSPFRFRQRIGTRMLPVCLRVGSARFAGNSQFLEDDVVWATENACLAFRRVHCSQTGWRAECRQVEVSETHVAAATEINISEKEEHLLRADADHMQRQYPQLEVKNDQLERERLELTRQLLEHRKVVQVLEEDQDAVQAANLREENERLRVADLRLAGNLERTGHLDPSNTYSALSASEARAAEKEAFAAELELELVERQGELARVKSDVAELVTVEKRDRRRGGDREERGKGWALLLVKQEAEFGVKRSGTHTARMCTHGGVCYECTRERYAETCENTRHTCCCLRRAPAGFRMMYPTRCREGHLREKPTRVEVDGDEFQVGREDRGVGIRVRATVDPCEEVAVMGPRLQKIM